MLSVESQVNGIPMSGKTVLITGATSGLGLATALLLAEQGAEVVMVGRDRTRANFMRAEIAKYAAGSEPILFLADLSSQAEIHRLAEKLHGSFSRIDVLINNAATMFADREVTPEGLRLTKELSMEDRSDIHYEDALDRELNALVREMEQEEVIRRAVIEMLVLLGSDAMLEHDV